MLRVVTGVEVCDPNPRSDLRTADRRNGGVELRMRGTAKPIRITGDAREIFVLRIDRLAGLRQRHPKLRIAAREPLLLQIRFHELWRRRPGHAESLLQQRMTEVPGVLL